MSTRQRTTMRLAAMAGAGLMGALGLALFGVPGRASPPAHGTAMDAAARREVVQAAIDNLERYYVFPAKAAAMRTSLLGHLRNGDFDAGIDPVKFAEALTATLQDDTQDHHLMVRYFPQPVPPQPPGQQDSVQAKAAEALEQQRFNYGLASAGRLKGNIGYLDLHQFGRLPGAATRMAAAMDLLAGTDALIVDLRHCGGGDPDAVKVAASYFFDTRTHLNDIYWRDENRTERRWTLDHVDGRRYGQTRAVYLLTSHDTFSGCEDFAYALKNDKRAIVVGEASGGGAHAGEPHRLTTHFMMFVPSGRPISPVTHTDWEGVGVRPDVTVAADKALDVAQVLALKGLIAGSGDADWKARLQERVTELK